MHTRRMVVAGVALCTLFTSTWMLPGAAAASEGARAPGLLAEMALSPSRVDWQPAGDYEQIVLTVAGPEGLWVRREFAAGQPVHLSLLDQEVRLPEGPYTYELRLVPRQTGKLTQRPLLEAGSFSIRGGEFVTTPEVKTPEDSTSVTEDQIRNITSATQVVPEPLVVQGGACIGSACGSSDAPAWGGLILKDEYLVLLFEDTGGVSYARDWAIQGSDLAGGLDDFSIRDVDAVTKPFSVQGTAPDYSLVVGNTGKIGLGTAIPGAPLHLYGSATSDAYAGMGPNPASGPAFNFGYGGSSFGRGAGYFNVRPDASATAPNPSLRLMTANVERMIVTNTGDVGLGTSSPSTQLHVRDTGSRGKILAENANGTTAARELLEIKNNGGAVFILEDTSVVQRWALGTVGSTIVFDNQANAGTEYSFGPTGNLTIAGALTQNSDRDTKRDIVPVQPEEILAKVAVLPIATWNRKLDPPSVRHLGPMAQDFAATFGLGEDNRHIGTLDMAGVSLASIQALYRMTTQKNEEIAQLRRENANLAERLAVLEALVLKGGRKEAEPNPAP